MTGELFINGKDAWNEWGVQMGNGFLDSLDGFFKMKPYIESNSRLEHGKKIITSNAKVDSRDITLDFTITGMSESDYRSKKKAFQLELQAGSFTLKVPSLGNDVYNMVYTGDGMSYALSLSRRFGHFSAKFTEPNPMNR